jgi:hypothetical protein
MSSSSFMNMVVVILLLILQASAIRVHHEGTLNKGLRLRGLSLTNYGGALPDPQYFDQKIDHFDPTNTKTFKQLFFVNDTFWTGAAKGGPVFIMLGGEGPVSPAYVLDHFVLTEYAAKFGALVVAVEHRFYGKSMPASDLSTQSLHLLTTNQALADYAQFRHFIATKYNTTSSSKWISFGGSYSGSLSAWFRLKYPHLIDGSIATSAPVQAQLNFPEYFEVVQTSLGPSCSRRVAKATSLIEQLLGSGAGRTKLQQMFTTCDPITSDDDVATFMSSLTDGICDIVQYNNDNNNYIPFNIEKLCSILEAGSTDDEILQSYVNFNNIFNQFSGQSCTPASYKSMITEMNNTNAQSDVAAARSWTWQTCTEYGYFQTGDSKAQPFSSTISLPWFLKQCKDIFGYPFTPNIIAINDIFGAKNLKETRVVLGNGSVDPWHILGITSPTRPCDQADETIRYMNGTAHCADLYPPTSHDLPELTETRKIEVALMQEWIYAKC